MTKKEDSLDKKYSERELEEKLSVTTGGKSIVKG